MPKVAHIGVERLPTGDDEDDGAEHLKGAELLVEEELHRECRAERLQHGRVRNNLRDAEQPRWWRTRQS